MNETPNKQTFREGFIDADKMDVAAATAKAAETAPQLEPSPAEQPETVETWPIVVKLMRKPVRDNKGNIVHELSFREPTGGDINRCGNPVRFNQDGDIIIDERKMHFMMAALCGILAPFLEQMDPRDWNACAYRIRNFFLPDPRGW